MNKMIKTSKIIQKILKILFWVIAAICVIAALSALITIIFTSHSKNDVPLSNGLTITLGNYLLKLNQEYSPRRFIPLLYITLANLLSYGILSCYNIRVLQTVFEPISQGKPFSTSVSGALKKLANAVLIFGVIRTILQIVTNHIFYNAFDLPSLFAADKVASCSISVVSDGSFIVWFFILRLFSHIFKYGEALQQLSDETL